MIFSLLDGSAVPSEYSEFKQNIVINNVNSIIPKEKFISSDRSFMSDERLFGKTHKRFRRIK